MRSQDPTNDTIQLYFESINQPLPGASIIIDGVEASKIAITGFDGIAQLILPKNQEIIRLNYLGPVTRLKIYRPSDSVYINLEKAKAIFYLNGKRIKKRRLNITGY